MKQNMHKDIREAWGNNESLTDGVAEYENVKTIPCDVLFVVLKPQNPQESVSRFKHGYFFWQKHIMLSL